MSDEFYHAAQSGELDELRRMLKADPSLVRWRDEYGFTALHGAVEEEDLTVVKFLIARGADPNAKNDEGVTPLHLAAYPEMVELLVKKGGKVNARTKTGATALQVQAGEAERLDVMEKLLELGAHPSASDDSGETALDVALSRQEDEKVALLLRYGAKRGAGKKRASIKKKANTGKSGRA